MCNYIFHDLLVLHSETIGLQMSRTSIQKGSSAPGLSHRGSPWCGLLPLFIHHQRIGVGGRGSCERIKIWSPRWGHNIFICVFITWRYCCWGLPKTGFAGSKNTSLIGKTTLGRVAGCRMYSNLCCDSLTLQVVSAEHLPPVLCGPEIAGNHRPQTVVEA